MGCDKHPLFRQISGGDNPLKVAVLASGRGSNLQAIIDASRNSSLHAEVVVVVSDNPGAFALTRAKDQGLAAVLVEPAAYPSKAAYETALAEVCAAHQAEVVALAGYMRLLGPVFLARFPNRVLNIHPALLPSFTGLHAQQQALEYGVRFSGCTVHLVDAGMDTGPILLQAVVPVLPDDNEETLAERILVQEHRIYPQALELIARGRIRIEGRRVLIDA